MELANTNKMLDMENKFKFDFNIKMDSIQFQINNNNEMNLDFKIGQVTCSI